MFIITHHTGEPHGLLGPQVVATFLTARMKVPAKVIGVGRLFDMSALMHLLKDHYRGRELVVGFSYMCGRNDLWQLMKSLRSMGFRVILGGPQADRDFLGEPKKDLFPHRIQGLEDKADLCFCGPIEALREEVFWEGQGLFRYPWTKKPYVQVDWGNLYFFSDKLYKLEVETAQVLRGVGCPYAARAKKVLIDPPAALKQLGPIELETKGCSFCDVAWDKGFCGYLSDEEVLEQIAALPEKEGKKIPFELIDEYPLKFLPRLLELCSSSRMRLRQINLVLRADDILRHQGELKEALKEAKSLGTKIMFSSIGFESFSDRILLNLNKGITTKENLEAIRILRILKREFPETLLYRRDEGSFHGFIHPTPWDDPDTDFELQRAIGAYELFEDVLPYHSTPLIVHHGSALGDWLRQIEETHGIRFGRGLTWIEWWEWKA